MEKKEILENISFQMVSAVNEARSYYLQAVQAARARDFKEAQKLIEYGDDRYTAGHAAHTQLLQMEADGNITQVNMLIMHAEDQLMSAEAFKTIALEFIDVYKRFEA